MRHAIAGFLLCALSLSTTSAIAGALASDPTAYQSGYWSGSTSFQGYDEDNNPTLLTGYVDYAVYAPGQFKLDFPSSPYAASVPSNEFVYAYQSFETNSAPVSSLSVDLYVAVDHIGSFSGINLGNGNGAVAGTVPSVTSTDGATFVTWNVIVPQGQSSEGLVFASVYPPQSDYGSTIDDGSAGYVTPLPTPNPLAPIPNAPEPTSIVPLAIGAIGLAAAARRRRRRARACTCD